MRHDGRHPDQLRPVEILPNYLDHPTGSCLIRWGGTHVLCAATVEDGVPRWLHGKGRGWLTAEYALLPSATHPRTQREVNRGKVGGRTAEIQRLIGRSLRAAVDLAQLGERTVYLDCDVINADGGTRTASITGSFVALSLALDRLVAEGALHRAPLHGALAAVSVGIVDGEPLLDLDYPEDFAAAVDMCVVGTDRQEIVEVQGTAEEAPFSRAQLDRLVDLAQGGIETLLAAQATALGAAHDAPRGQR
ncbi:MAG: ribonuclease PH [Nitrospirae bacterium CG18_big_fil_WC_8_21_14_2_50_70_55]|nr:ribonuclease PH [Deltaproteobacteria bacterium]OIP63279.1 MAG: ribonuclease PH [Nitrospirae bacterium CG2_30_70_394]PIQ06645.1 MAG: ribonuclease PH [Nitrospirae bacterium CG18_big_fil_WC_8_21_14_2_50_70_55]PIU78427.1 MAG: ribonuclease PH [Nitrospirae bacterium CG06_land_8_20_14_3_00_70_43]PIW84040.1 MAG: ribonuclease PH [Nitrospirae bacterium CG_4_8_14_3_um_filter_70_85]PIX84171.1 MAG: ribonuclease PH [Nitrospirae bacterium CG_4_10_14_3_um_filter_70_108]PJB96078.1 MAG: ribonuclease PH [Nit